MDAGSALGPTMNIEGRACSISLKYAWKRSPKVHLGSLSALWRNVWVIVVVNGNWEEDVLDLMRTHVEKWRSYMQGGYNVYKD